MGLQFIGLGLLGEYLGRIYHDVRDRPRYVKSRIVGRPGSISGISLPIVPADEHEMVASRALKEERS